MKSLVVFYSLDGNTRFISEKIAEKTGSDLLELKPVKEISRNTFAKMFSGGKQAMTKATPALQPYDIKWEDYDLIFVGTPVWAWTFAPALRTYFTDNKIENKKLALFCCHGGGPGKIFEKMEEKLSENTILGKIMFKDPLKHDKEKDGKEAANWAQQIISAVDFNE